jgi:hypothetical protein
MTLAFADGEILFRSTSCCSQIVLVTMTSLMVMAYLLLKISTDLVDIGTNDTTETSSDSYFENSHGKWTERLNGIVFYAPFCLVVLCHVLEGLTSHSFQVIRSVQDSNEYLDILARLKATTPRLIMSVDCYHHPDLWTNPLDELRWVTHSAKVTVGFQDCCDISREVDISRCAVASVRLVPLFCIADAHNFERKKRDFIDEHRQRDVHLDFSTDFVLPGLDSESALLRNGRVSSLFNPVVFWLGLFFFHFLSYACDFRNKHMDMRSRTHHAHLFRVVID